MNGKLFIFGVGYSGLEIARGALARGWSVAGTTRSIDKAEKLRSLGIEPHLFDGTALSDELAAALRETSHLVISIAPGEADPVLHVAGETILKQMPKLRWVGYLSTVGVYGDHGGSWVDEETECRPVSKRSVERLEAEQAWQALGDEASVPVAVLRLAGIYGPGRNAFVNLANGTARRIVKPGQVFNRIHVADIAASTLHLAERSIGGTFNITDDEPCPPQDVVACAAKLMGVEPPPEFPFDEAEMSPMARSFYGENKRVSNARLKAAGLVLKFPDYRAALDDLWRHGNWRGEAS